MKKLAFFLSFTILFISCTKNEIEENTIDPRLIGKWNLTHYSCCAYIAEYFNTGEVKVTWKFHQNGSLEVVNDPSVVASVLQSGAYAFKTLKDKISSSNGHQGEIIINNFTYGYLFTDKNSRLEIYGDVASDGPWYRFVKSTD